MMTRKNYEAIARGFVRSRPLALRDESGQPQRAYSQWAWDMLEVADELAIDNPRFDFSRFYAACHAGETETYTKGFGRMQSEYSSDTTRKASGS